ncbi:nucleotidyltransferase family protein [Tissierella sp. Yu-01]|uniref:nucleotidyltransferase family protein n=1 Tax=Tissierella sp. Yu-01 TaxID=3035694 RepID=UPI00240D3DA3|nr:nucleotidyltransferase family protein [Tissierella sp. Yu-01]WFA07829.1 nucleotidyltransferase family protein [Tissierella sp. Yu-01]
MITGIIMASGFSNRMGKNKLLLEIEGIKVIERVIKACKESMLDDIILAYRLDEIREIGDKYGIRCIFNSNAHEGQSASVKLGVENADKKNGYMFLVGDQPFLTRELIDKLIREYNMDTKNIVVPYFNNKFGMPIIFPSHFRENLLKVTGDKGGREIIQSNPELVRKIQFEDELMGVDIDTIEDLERISEMHNSQFTIKKMSFRP